MAKRKSDEDNRNQILDRTVALFLARGVSPLTMDDIATAQGISKKTLYKFFPNKTALIEASIETKIRGIAAAASKVADDRSTPFLDRLRSILRVVSGQISQLGEPLIRDVFYNMPEVWEQVDRLRREYVFSVINRLFEEGIKTGYIRGDIDGKLVPLLFINSVSSVMTPSQLLSLPFPPAQLFDAFFRILFGGILTEDARRAFFSKEAKK